VAILPHLAERALPVRDSQASTGMSISSEGYSPGAARRPVAGHSGRGRLLPDRRVRRERTHHAFRALKAQHAAGMSPFERLATRLTVVAGSTPFLVLHLAWFAGWIGWNATAGPRAFDPFPYGLLTMVVSLEAIVLSIFVLMTQNRESAITEVREEVTLAVNLRVEEEVTKVLELVAGLYGRLGYEVAEDPALAEMLQPLDAAEIERDLVEQIQAAMVGLRRR
jgi:uncharacterized membrane protein